MCYNCLCICSIIYLSIHCVICQSLDTSDGDSQSQPKKKSKHIKEEWSRQEEQSHEDQSQETTPASESKAKKKRKKEKKEKIHLALRPSPISFSALEKGKNLPPRQILKYFMTPSITCVIFCEFGLSVTC